MSGVWKNSSPIASGNGAPNTAIELAKTYERQLLDALERDMRDQAVVVRRTEKREMYVWIVPGMPVPARILQKENGRETINLLVRSISP